MPEIGEQLRKRQREIDREMSRCQEHMTQTKELLSRLRGERRQIASVLRGLERGPGKHEPVVSDDNLLDAVAAVCQAQENGKATAVQVAEHLGVSGRNVGRKLRKLVDLGALLGNAEQGYWPDPFPRAARSE
jgi:DNA-binding transcriptional ArsR family regulator